MSNEKLDLNQIANENIKKKEGRKLNIKNIMKVFVTLFLLIAFLIGSFNLFKDFKKYGNEKVNEKVDDEEQKEKDVSTELKDMDYSSSRDKVIDEKINKKYEEAELEEYNNPDYNIPATDDEPDPIDPMEQFMKEQELKKMQRLYEARESGFKRGSGVMSSLGNNEISSDSNSSPAYSNDSDYMKYIMAGIGGGTDPNIDPNMQKQKLQFLKNAAIDNFVLQKPLTPAISKFEVKTGTLIPVIITSSINSDLPGSISAMVRENVYDTLTGTELLIPMGSKLYGKFSSEVSWGQTRVQAVFNRLTLPNGKSINLGAMGVADAQGRSGLTGDVDLHLGKVIGSIIMAGVVGGADGALTNNGNYRKDGNSALSRAGEESGRTTVETVDKYTSKVLEVQPTIWVEAGSRATLMIEEDLILEKYDKKIRYLAE